MDHGSKRPGHGPSKLSGLRGLPLLVAGLAGCGIPLPFVNPPASISIRSVEPATVTVTLTKDANNNITASFKNPVVTLEGAPGSIGASFTAMELRALDPANGNALRVYAGNSLDMAVTPISLHVQSSALREDPRQGTANPNDLGSQKLVLGQGKAELPIVTNEIIDIGKSKAKGVLTVSAQLKGTDEAKWPIGIEVLVPVAFSGP